MLDYLCHSCYLSTARAFARDSAIRHLDGDGDEMMPLAKGLEGDLVAGFMEGVLRSVEHRDSEFLLTPYFFLFIFEYPSIICV